jgi:predicted nucleic acid-binding protein
VDALIAAIALENHATVFTLDRNFFHLARVTKLPLHTP